MNPSAESIVLSILLPVRNEGINLKIMLKILRSILAVPHEVIVVHDTEGDDSIAIVQAMQGSYPELRLVRNGTGRGIINAIKVGVDASKGANILIFAADEVGPVLAIEDLLELMYGGCEFVSCTRYAHGGRRLGGSFVGGALSWSANKAFHWLARCPFTDATTGIKMFRKECFGRLDLRSRPVGWAVAFEMAIKAQHAGLRLGEVPIVSIDRLYGGESSFRLGPWVAEYLRWFLWGLRRSWSLDSSARRECLVRIPSYHR
jgi:glycosyltransferase involved in cell wall biosynthesis